MSWNSSKRQCSRDGSLARTSLIRSRSILAYDKSGAFAGSGDQNAEWIKDALRPLKATAGKIGPRYIHGIFDGPRLEQRQPMLFFERSRIPGGWQNNEISPSERKISEQLREPQDRSRWPILYERP